MSKITDMVLAPGVTEQQRQLLVRYAARPRSIRPGEWRDALTAFDEMGGSIVVFAEQHYTFATFYEEFLEGPLATGFLEELIALTVVEIEGFRLLKERCARILKKLEQEGARPTGSIEERCLIAFCHYWWTSFSKGYIREIAVFRDLRAFGVLFEAHDLLDRRQRFQPFDLTVSGWRGDIKTSTYFLHVRRSFPLRNDFYIVALYDEVAQQRLRVVMVKPRFWSKLNGDTKWCVLREVRRHFPEPVRITVRGEQLVVVPYAAWKERVLRLQQDEEISG